VPFFLIQLVSEIFGRFSFNMKTRSNPLGPKGSENFDIQKLKAPNVFRHRRLGKKAVIHMLKGIETARRTMEVLEPGIDVFGFTKGDFDLLDLVCAINEKFGPFEVLFSTWTASLTDLGNTADRLKSEEFSRVRFLLDHSFIRRQPSAALAIKEIFGPENFATAATHAKFVQLKNTAYRITIKTSMNLNKNPRMEHFDISWSHPLFLFIETIVEEIFAKQQKSQ